MAVIKPFEKIVEMAKQKVISEIVYSSRNMNVMDASPYLMTPRSPSTFMWKIHVIIITEMSRNMPNLKYQDAQ